MIETFERLFPTKTKIYLSQTFLKREYSTRSNKEREWDTQLTEPIHRKRENRIKNKKNERDMVNREKERRQRNGTSPS